MNRLVPDAVKGRLMLDNQPELYSVPPGNPQRWDRKILSFPISVGRVPDFSRFLYFN